MTRHNPPPTAHLDTQAIHAGEMPDALGAHISPIYQTSTYVFENMQQVDAFNSGETAGYMYSRSRNPSREALAAKIAALEGYGLNRQAQAAGKREPVVAAEVYSSGMAAISAALLGTARAGGHVIAQDVLYSSTEHLIAELLPRYGISVSRVKDLNPNDLARELEAQPHTQAVFLETPANPTMTLVDIAAVSELAQAHGARVIVDNTFATPVLQRPLELGADVVVHSTTKYIGGHGVVMGGAVVSNDIPLLTEEIGPLIKFLGGVPSPFECWLTGLGLKTLPLRMRQHCANAMAVAQFLAAQPQVAYVAYPGLESFPQHELARRQMADFGAMIAFELKGGYEAGRELMDAVRLCVLAVSLGNLDTLIEHPASMTHSNVPPEVRAKAGISDGLIRLSVGLEAAQDITADLAQALDKLG
ncbi:MAG: trans-sulfuration enzyme family protein [Anaerolineae bacterium]